MATNEEIIINLLEEINFKLSILTRIDTINSDVLEIIKTKSHSKLKK